MSALTDHTMLPWEVVPATEHHGPYITTCYGTTVCDLYHMSDPMTGERKPITFTDGAENVILIATAVNSHDALVDALKAMCAEFRAHDLPYGSSAYVQATRIIAALATVQS